VAGFDGDLPQHFMLEVSESPVYPDTTPPTQKHSSQVELNDQGTEHSVPGPPLYRVFGAEPVFALNALEPGRDYELAVYAVNAKGRSVPPVIIPRVRVSASMERLTKTGNDYVLFGTKYKNECTHISVTLWERGDSYGTRGSYDKFVKCFRLEYLS